MDELIEKITTQFNIPADKAQGIIKTVVGFLGDKLPGPIGSQLNRLLGDDDDNKGDAGSGGGGGLMDQAKSALGGLLGGND